MFSLGSITNRINEYSEYSASGKGASAHRARVHVATYRIIQRAELYIIIVYILYDEFKMSRIEARNPRVHIWQVIRLRHQLILFLNYKHKAIKVLLFLKMKFKFSSTCINYCTWEIFIF